MASGIKDCKILRFALKYGMDAYALNNYGYTPAHFAVERDDAQILGILKILDEYQADFTIKNLSNETPLLLLMYVCVLKKSNYLKCVKYLIRKTLLHMSRTEDLETVQIEPTLETLLQLFHEPLLSYYHKCVSEIVEMKTDVILHGISVLEIANGESSMDEIGTGGNSHAHITHHILQQLAKNAYPVFGDIIADLLGRSNLMGNLNHVRMSSMLQVDSNQIEIILPSSCLLHIAKYLPNRNLINLNLASYGTWKSDVTEFDKYFSEIADIFKNRQLPERSKWFKNIATNEDASDDDSQVSNENTSDHTSDDSGPDNIGDASDDDDYAPGDNL